MNDKVRFGRSGFTLVEVLVVAGLLAVLAMFVILASNRHRDGPPARVTLARAIIGWNGPIGKGLEAYKRDMGAYPDTDEALQALYQPKSAVDDERYKGPYMEGDFEELTDPWGNAYIYKSPGEINETGYDLYSMGPDGKDDGGKEGSDDIKNWIDK